jgi:hypothetical protein
LGFTAAIADGVVQIELLAINPVIIAKNLLLELKGFDSPIL